MCILFYVTNAMQLCTLGQSQAYVTKQRSITITYYSAVTTKIAKFKFQASKVHNYQHHKVRKKFSDKQFHNFVDGITFAFYARRLAKPSTQYADI
jgi:hypothetical protein